MTDGWLVATASRGLCKNGHYTGEQINLRQRMGRKRVRERHQHSSRKIQERDCIV